MIVDKTDNWSVYFNKESYSKIFVALEKFNIETPNGEYRSNDNYYFKIMSYKKQLESIIIESQSRELDIQHLLKGKEEIKIDDAQYFVTTNVYNE